MWLKKLYATFGKLENETLDLSEGLNVIYGDNESGKSTWSAFIRAMFFGISSREQRKAGFIPDKEKYLPWKGLPMYGKMELSFLGKDMTIERRAGKNNVLSSESATFDKSGKAAPLGEELLGVPRSVYERTAYIKQAGVAVDGDTECEKRILAIASSGDEEVSSKEVLDRLRKWQRGSGKTVSSNTKEIDELSKKLSAGEEVEREISRLEESLEAAAEEIKKTTRAIEIAKAERRKQSTDYIEGVKRGFEEAKEKVILLSKYPTRRDLDLFRNKREEFYALNAKKEQVQREVADLADEVARIEAQISETAAFSGCSSDMAKASAESDIQRVENAAGKKSVSVSGIILFALAFIAFVLEISLKSFALLIPAVVLFAFSVAVMLISAIRSKKNNLTDIKKKYGAAERTIVEEKLRAYLELLSEKEEKSYKISELSITGRELELSASKTSESAFELLSGFGIEEKDISLAEVLLRERTEARETAEDELNAARARVEAVENAKSEEALPIEYTEEEIPEESPEELSARISLLSEKHRKLELALVNLRAELRGFDRQKAESELSQKEEALKKVGEELSALSLAAEVLAEAEGELKNRFSPELERRASEIFEKLCDGRFSFVKIRDNDFNMQVRSGIAEEMRDSLTLSQGTYEELYFSLRLALFEMIVQSEKAPPVILDDALVNFDDTRMRRALDILLEMSEKNQVIIFSCHSREAEYLKGKPRVNIIKL